MRTEMYGVRVVRLPQYYFIGVVVRTVRVRLHMVDVGFVDVQAIIEDGVTPNITALQALRGKFRNGGFVFLNDMEGNLFAVNTDKVVLMVPMEVQ